MQDRYDRFYSASLTNEKNPARLSRDEIPYASMAQVMLNPGLVELGILDSLVGGVPMVTVDSRGHDSEIAYLCDGVNGIMTTNEMGSYRAAVVALLGDEEERARLRARCRVSGEKYTLENTALRFGEGIACCSCAPHYDRLPLL